MGEIEPHIVTVKQQYKASIPTGTGSFFVGKSPWMVATIPKERRYHYGN
jgi:hypothetical protein